MIGYIIELYKNIISDDETQESDNKALKANGYTTFGDFDRMAVSKTTAFSRMRDMSQLSRTWTGDRQTILLYELLYWVYWLPMELLLYGRLINILTY